jgi:nitrogenase molybdenum-iron protein alpha/beta subunit
MTGNHGDSSGLLVGYDFLAPYLDGVYLAVNAIEDAYLVYDAHDCGYTKAEKIAGNHDLLSSLMRWDQVDRIVRTNIESREFIMGSDDRLSMKLRQVAERYCPGVIFVARSNVMIFTGHDSSLVLDDLGREIPVPLVRIPEKNADQDHLTGYLDAVDGILSLMEPCSAPRGENRVLLAGYVFDRCEGDHQGNLAEFDRMLRAVGAEPGAVLLDGGPVANLLGSEPPDLVVDMAAGWEGASRFAERAGAAYLQAGLPLGLEGTAAWLRGVAQSLDLGAQAGEFIDGELSRLARRLQWILPLFFLGRSVVVFADRFWLGPLCDHLQELGFNVRAAGSTSAPARPEDQTVPLPEGVTRVPRKVPDLLDFMSDLRNKGEADLVIGNSFLHQVLIGHGIPFVEMGYPSNFHHVLHPSPTLGFSGVEVLAERMVNALSRPGTEAKEG